MSLVFEEYETKQRKMFDTSGILRIETDGFGLCIVELRSGKQYKTTKIRFVNQ